MGFIKGFGDMFKYFIVIGGATGLFIGGLWLLSWATETIGIIPVIVVVILLACIAYGVFRQHELNKYIKKYQEHIATLEDIINSNNVRIASFIGEQEVIRIYEIENRECEAEIIKYKDYIHEMKKTGQLVYD